MGVSMKGFFLAIILAMGGSGAALAAQQCGGQPEPQICKGSCFENYDCVNGSWKKSSREDCAICGEMAERMRQLSNDRRPVLPEEPGKCGGQPEPKVCKGSCFENYDCVNGKWKKSGREDCALCGEMAERMQRLMAPAQREAAGKCGGKFEPKICKGSCFVNFDCVNGKWKKSSREDCAVCAEIEEARPAVEDPNSSNVQ